VRGGIREDGSYDGPSRVTAPRHAAAGPNVTRFLVLNALANAGGVIAYLPLLSLLLPMKIGAMAGEARFDVLTATVVAGATAAAGSNVLFGWLSDRAVAHGHGRRGWVAGGLAGTVASYGAVTLASSPMAIVVSIVLFQFAVNAMLAPLFAIMADEIPDSHKRTAGGLLALGNPLAAAVSALLVGTAISGEDMRLAIIALAVAACVVPIIVSRARPALEDPGVAREEVLRRDLAFAWGARLLVQVAGAALAYYIFYYFESVTPEAPYPAFAQHVGQVLTISYLLPLPVAILVGRWSDRTRRGKPFLIAAAMTAALGLAGMAIARDWTGGAIAFAVYAVGVWVFLSLHSGFAMQLLPSPEHRGRDLGLLNLTNTLPALLGPVLTWMLATPRDFGPAMAVLAVLTAAGGLMMLAVRGRR
jgi:MFS family permease